MKDQMRRTPPDRAGRLPAPRAVLVPRSRLAPLAIALPLVLGLWLTIGLPIFAEVSGTAGGGGPMRDFLFGAAATGGSPGSGGDKRGPCSGHRGCRGRRPEDRARGAPGADPRADHRLRRPAPPQRRAQARRRPQRPQPAAAARPRLRSVDFPAGRATSGASAPAAGSIDPASAGARPARRLRRLRLPCRLRLRLRPSAVRLRLRRLPASASSASTAGASAPASATPASASSTAAPPPPPPPRLRLRRPRCRRPPTWTRSTAAARPAAPETGDTVTFTYAGTVNPDLILRLGRLGDRGHHPLRRQQQRRRADRPRRVRQLRSSPGSG